jgi:hypothetical protein
LLVFAIKAVEKPDISPKYPAFQHLFRYLHFRFSSFDLRSIKFLDCGKGFVGSDGDVGIMVV